MKYKKLKMTILGIASICLVKIGGYLAKLPNEVTDSLVKGIITLVGIYIGSQGISDGLSRGKTATVETTDDKKE